MPNVSPSLNKIGFVVSERWLKVTQGHGQCHHSIDHIWNTKWDDGDDDDDDDDDDNDDDDDEIAYFTVRWKTRASFVYRTKNVDNNDKDSKNRKRSH